MNSIHKALIIFTAIILTGCSKVTPTVAVVVDTPMPPTATALQPATNTPTPENTPTPLPPTATPTPVYPQEGYGPVGFPENVNPLTGLELKDASILDRRPVIVKVQNLPRADRPQWGVSAADIVYEYYTELGTTRFSAIYYGQDAEQVAPVRSARLFDINLIRAYKSMFIFGSAYEGTYNRLVNSEFYNRLMLESSNTASVITRYDPNAKNFEMADTSKVNAYTKQMGIDNSIQDLDGMLFQMQTPVGGKVSPQTYVRFSGAIYNRWDYDTATNKYNRFVDADNAINGVPETYVQLVDRANNEPIAVENVVMIFVRHTDIDSRPTVEVLDVSLLGTGKAYAMRDGNLYEVTWSRPTEQSVLTLLNADGSPFAFRPGKTWVEVMSYNTLLEEQDDGAFRFKFVSDW